jgi:glutathione S-transferase
VLWSTSHDEASSGERKLLGLCQQHQFAIERKALTMLLHETPFAPNPLRVRLFLAEKGIDVPRKTVNLLRLEHKQAEFTALNPWQSLPVLELADGTGLTETMAICRYFEELHPEPHLFGQTALERATIEMWQRRIELELFLPVAMAFRHTHRAMANLQNPQFPEWGEYNRSKALEALDLVERQLMMFPFVAGERFSVADITMAVTLIAMKPAKLPLPDHIPHVKRWKDMIWAKPRLSPLLEAKPERKD